MVGLRHIVECFKNNINGIYVNDKNKYDIVKYVDILKEIIHIRSLPVKLTLICLTFNLHLIIHIRFFS